MANDLKSMEAQGEVSSIQLGGIKIPLPANELSLNSLIRPQGGQRASI
jgi:hypothetical protein